MIQVAPSRSQKGLVAWAVFGIVLLVFLATFKALPSEPVATGGPSAIAVAPIASSSSSPRPTRKPTPTLGPIPTLPPPPTQGPCELPTSLPTDATSAATPKVDGRVGSILFASPIYTRNAAGQVVAASTSINFNMGLWFVPAPGAEPNLITAAGPGMVVPLALSPNGTEAAVWWVPERRAFSDVPCDQGIYTIDLTNGANSRLVQQGDWLYRASNATEGSPDWNDLSWALSERGELQIPQAAFSFDGSMVAIGTRERIDVYRSRAPSGGSEQHTGTCLQWGWAPNADRFVAGCEDMTSAWLVTDSCCDGGFAAQSIAIAPPPAAEFPSWWENGQGRAIGFNGAGDIKVVRTYGIAIDGCSEPGCEMPSPAWVVTSIDHETQQITHAFGTLNVIVDSDARLAADASWYYGYLATDPPPSVTLDFSTATSHHVGTLGTAAGAKLDGSTLYGWRMNPSGLAVVQEATPTGTKAGATIGPAPDAVPTDGGVTVLGLWVGAAT